MDPKVSISIITYNHVGFIAQAIDSVLMQATTFEYEILIGEDDSSDGTREIVAAYAHQYPDRIRLFLNDRRHVIYVDGKPTGRWNLVNNLKHARGEYVALLEGDDYWTSPHKLQRQADFLDSHPECAICFHPVMRRYEEENRETASFRTPLTREVYTLEDLLEGNLIAACSVMYRNRLFGEFPDWYFTVPVGDWPLHILNAQHGEIGYIDDVMSVYRIHGGGIRSSRQAAQKLRSSIVLLETVKQHLGPRYQKQLNDGIARRQLELVYLYLRARDWAGTRAAIRELPAKRHIPVGSWARGVVCTMRRAAGWGQVAPKGNRWPASAR